MWFESFIVNIGKKTSVKLVYLLGTLVEALSAKSKLWSSCSGKFRGAPGPSSMSFGLVMPRVLILSL